MRTGEEADGPPKPRPDVRDQVLGFFGPESPLRRAPEVGGRPYEVRPQQLAMATAICESWHTGDHLCVEAPTGVGKSFAYLLPAIHWSLLTGRPVVISTHTIALQEQLMNKDIPILQQLAGVEFTAALAKGRQNYVCRHRLEKAAGGDQEYLPMESLLPEVARIKEWAADTEDGSMADMDFKPGSQTWSSVCSEAGVCPYEKGNGNELCFYKRARRKLRTANLIVANHALVCVDLAARHQSDGKSSLLPDYSALIIDEAHTFEDVAATHLGLRLSTYGVSLLFNRLYNPRNNRGLLARAEGRHLVEQAVETMGRTDRFFTQIRDWILEQDEQPVTYSVAGHIPNHLDSCWSELAEAMRLVVNDEDVDDDWRNELALLTTRLLEYRDGLRIFLDRRQEHTVYWLETNGRRQQYVTLNAVPVEVRDLLREHLFDQDFCVTMTSATLEVNGSMAYFQGHLGVEEARTLTLDTPYDFANQVEFHAPASAMPDPRNEEHWIPAVCDQIRHFVGETGGRAFVLFTSYRQMNQAADELDDFFLQADIRLFVQGRDLQRSQMLDAFREDITSVIFGTSSFWTGVDVPGEALSNVIIVKLPFPVPSHPLVAARRELLESRGGNSFRDYFLPEAILKFRQGIGRLIRSVDDRGIIVVLDPRIITTGYGKTFMRAVPDCPRHIT